MIHNTGKKKLKDNFVFRSRNQLTNLRFFFNLPENIVSLVRRLIWVPSMDKSGKLRASQLKVGFQLRNISAWLCSKGIWVKIG
jgi:hypothetical protein